MNLAISVCPHERALALKWFQWAKELGGTEGHSLYLIPVAEMDATEVVKAAQDAFASVTVVKDAEAIKSDWQGPEPARSASGPNSAFRQIAWDMYLNKRGPWFWCEVDAIPLKPNWLGILEAEYVRGGKPFMGAMVKIERVPEHLTGNSVYPQNVPELAPTVVMRTNWTSEGREYELAFDIAGAAEILPKSHFTNLIQHKFRHAGFKTRAEFEATIDPAAVIFHSCKDQSIFQFLKGGDAPFPSQSDTTTTPQIAPVIAATTDVTAVGSNAAPTFNPNGAVDSREALVRDWVAVGKQLCTAPRYIAAVRKELKLQGVIK